MNNKNIILTILACMGAALLPIPMLIDVWGYYIGDTLTYRYGLFDNFENVQNVFAQGNEKFQSIWAIMVTILAVAALIIGVAFILFSILQILKTGKIKYHIVRRFLSLAMLLVFVLSTIFGFVFTDVNVYSYNVILFGKVVVTMGREIGFYILIAGTFISGLFGVLSTFEKKRKKENKS